jgi:hypothetical protein
VGIGAFVTTDNFVISLFGVCILVIGNWCNGVMWDNRLFPLVILSHLLYDEPMESKIIKNNKFRKIATNVKPDVKNRIVLSKVVIAEDVTYHLYCNEIGQIILDPHISVPVSEIWLYKNPQAREAVTTGLREAAEGKVLKINLSDL